MSGHNKWSKIKQKKRAADQKRAQVFGKLLKSISIAARSETNPEFNPQLRSAIEKARQSNVPKENIERAVNKASETKNLEEVTLEAYGPEKAAIIIETITDNTNRTISEIRHLLDDNNAKMADQGSVLWAFKFRQPVSDDTKEKIQSLIEKLEEHDDVQKVITNIQ